MPDRASRTVIRHNVFSKRAGGATGADARPNVLVGHFPLTGAGANDRYDIYGNFFFENPTEALFQGEGHLAVHDNLFVNTAGSAIHVQPHNDVPRDVHVHHNTILAAGNGVSLSGGHPGHQQKIVANVVFARMPIRGSDASANVTGSFASASDYLTAPFASLGTLDLFPRTGTLRGESLLLDQFDVQGARRRDFNGVERTGAFPGAYEGEGANPGWKLSLTRKPQVD